MKVQDSLQRGIMPSAEILDGFMILAGGIALLTPGFITDVLGLLLLFPATRAGIKWLLRRKFQSMIKQGQVVHFGSFGAKVEELWYFMTTLMCSFLRFFLQFPGALLLLHTYEIQR